MKTSYLIYIYNPIKLCVHSPNRQLHYP